jgi:hypothetical protein
MGARLPAPLAGTVDVFPGRDASRIVLGVTSAVPLDDGLLSLRPEQVPGASAPRRVLKLHCQVLLAAKPPAGGARSDQMLALENALYALDDSTMRNGSALLPGDASDPGFLIRSMVLSHSEPPDAITLDVDGLFWPAGTPGASGVAIVEADIRAAFQPLLLSPSVPKLVAGGPAVDLQLTFGATGTMQVKTDGVTSSPYGTLIVRVIDSGGRPGAGALTGGSEAPGGARALPVSGGSATLTYTPPAQPATDILVVTLDDSAGGAGIELGRFTLRVLSS